MIRALIVCLLVAQALIACDELVIWRTCNPHCGDGNVCKAGKCIAQNGAEDGSSMTAQPQPYSAETWTDTTSGLTWQVSPTDNISWEKAKAYCETLTLDTLSDWRLPTISELRTLVRGCVDTETNGACGLADTCRDWTSCRNIPCDGCTTGEGPASGCYWPGELKGQCSLYWSSTEDERAADEALYLHFGDGGLFNHSMDAGLFVRCIR
jgi:hypothetical protein